MRAVLFAAAAAWVFTPQTPRHQPALQPALQPVLGGSPVLAPLQVRGAAPASAAGQPVLWFFGGVVAAALARPLALAATQARDPDPATKKAARRARPAGRRGAVQGAVTVALGGLLAATPPGPAFARSKEKAAEKALQKSTAKEARQAMLEYKMAPRPELVGSAEKGYTFKEGTVKAGSTGELAGYFKEKGADIQADYKATKARAVGATAAEAQQLAATAKNKAPPTMGTKKKELSNDELIIRQRMEQLNGQRDDMGRCLGLKC